jgi:hypothetical protein
MGPTDLRDNSWFTGFTDSDGHFGVKIVESKPKSETRNSTSGTVSENISLKFRLDQRSPQPKTQLSFFEG